MGNVPAPMIGHTSVQTLDQLGTLAVWFRGHDITGKSDGDALTSFNDASGNNRTATFGSNAGTYKANQINGYPIIRFWDNPAVHRCYAATPSISAIAAWTVFMVVKSFGSDAAYFLDATDGSHSIIDNFTAGKIEYYSTPRTVLANRSTSAFQIVTCTVGGTITGPLTLGGSGGGFNLSGMDMAELAIYNSALSAGNVSVGQSILAAKYGL